MRRTASTTIVVSVLLLGAARSAVLRGQATRRLVSPEVQSDGENADNTWHALKFPEAVAGRSLDGDFVLDAKQGYPVGEKGLCLATRDGGAAWQVIETGAAATLRFVRFKDDKTGWICGAGDPNAPETGGHVVLSRPLKVGRDAALLERLAAAGGLHILTNTGFYGARQGNFLPDFVMKETADQLATRWLCEWKDGIDGTGIRPGFIKVGVDVGALPEINRKLIQAAAGSHLDSGLTIAAHTGDSTAALEELKLVREAGVDGRAFSGVHAQNEKDTVQHVRAAAEQGAWVEFDGIGPRTVGPHVELVKSMKAGGHLDRVLLSHDAGGYHVGEPDGGTFRPFDTLFTNLLPALKKAGLTDADVKQLTVDSPREAFTIRVRARK